MVIIQKLPNLQIKRFHLTREGKNKAEKNRSKVSEAFWKSIHAAKAEKAQVSIFIAWSASLKIKITAIVSVT